MWPAIHRLKSIVGVGDKGKTLGYLVPILNLMYEKGERVQVNFLKNIQILILYSIKFCCFSGNFRNKSIYQRQPQGHPLVIILSPFWESARNIYNDLLEIKQGKWKCR